MLQCWWLGRGVRVVVGIIYYLSKYLTSGYLSRYLEPGVYLRYIQ